MNGWIARVSSVMTTVIVIMMRHSMSDIVACDTDSDSESDKYSEMTGIILHNIYVSHTNYHLSTPHIQHTVTAIQSVRLTPIYDKVESFSRYITPVVKCVHVCQRSVSHTDFILNTLTQNLVLRKCP